MIEVNFILGLAIYGIVWFISLFMILPIGVTTQDEAGEIASGSSPSAPTRPQIGRKLIITTIIAALIYAAIYWMLTSDILRHLSPLANLVFGVTLIAPACMSRLCPPVCHPAHKNQQ